jgi:hypothetical protein
MADTPEASVRSRNNPWLNILLHGHANALVSWTLAGNTAAT